VYGKYRCNCTVYHSLFFNAPNHNWSFNQNELECNFIYCRDTLVNGRENFARRFETGISYSNPKKLISNLLIQFQYGKIVLLSLKLKNRREIEFVDFFQSK